jgi:cell division septum initiation protein DivIVA
MSGINKDVLLDKYLFVCVERNKLRDDVKELKEQMKEWCNEKGWAKHLEALERVKEENERLKEQVERLKEKI